MSFEQREQLQRWQSAGCGLNELVQATLRAIYSERSSMSDDRFWFNHFNVFVQKGQTASSHFLRTHAIRPRALGKIQGLLMAKLLIGMLFISTTFKA